jgi:hypothetical protein
MEIDKKILEKIDNKIGKGDITIKVYQEITEFGNKHVANAFLRGFLLDMDTAKAVWPDKKGSGGLVWHESVGHLHKMVLLPSNSDILKYYERYL